MKRIAEWRSIHNDVVLLRAVVTEDFDPCMWQAVSAEVYLKVFDEEESNEMES